MNYIMVLIIGIMLGVLAGRLPIISRLNRRIFLSLHEEGVRFLDACIGLIVVVAYMFMAFWSFFSIAEMETSFKQFLALAGWIAYVVASIWVIRSHVLDTLGVDR